MDSPKYITYDGLNFCRDDKTGYYLNSTIRKRLHRYVWEKEVGTIPKGCQIHHINGDKSDNSIENLAILTASGHQRLHWREQKRKETAKENIEVARPYAIAWHKSDAGREWHSKQATGRKPKRVTKKCEVCGKQFQGTKLQMFCSNACKAKFRRDSGADDVERICEECHRPFMTTRFKNQKYCSRECRYKAHVGWRERWLKKQS